MGANSSKPDGHFERQDSRRLSRRRQSKEPLDSIVTFVQILHTEIQNYSGYRKDERYKEIQKMLANYSQEIEMLRTKRDSQFFDHAQKEINVCLRLLEQRVIDNEKRLDVAAVESHSFINQNLSKKPDARRSHKNQAKSSNTLDNIERQIADLDEEINRTLHLEFNKKMFVFLEKKIHLLYTDLEMISPQPHTPLHERKELLGRQLVKFNNKLKRAKHTKSTISVDELASSSNSKDLLREIQAELQTLEVQVSTFNDVKTSETFAKIKDALNNHWAKLQDMKNEQDSLKKHKFALAEKIKIRLSALNEQASKNQVKFAVDNNKLANIRKDIDSFQHKHQQGKTKGNYEDVLKVLAERVKTIGDFEALRKDKEQLLEELEQLNKSCSEEEAAGQVDDVADGVAADDNNRDDKAKKIFWQLRSSIEDLTSLKDVGVLEEIRDGINAKLKTLKEDEPIYAEPFENRRNTGRQGRMLDEASSRDSIDNILESLEVVETEYNTLRTQKTKPEPTPDLPPEAKPEPEAPKPEMTRNSKPMHYVMDVDAKVQDLSKQIRNFNGNNEQDKQFVQIRNSLEACSVILAEIPDYGGGESVNCAKREIRTQIDRMRDDLNRKLAENRDHDLDEFETIKAVVSDIKKIKKRIDCFSGLHNNTLFKQIDDSLVQNEEKLQELLGNLKYEKLKSVIEDVLGKTAQFRRILDEKSIKVVQEKQYSGCQESYKMLEQIRNRMLVIKTDMENYSGTRRQDDFNRICADLMGCHGDLDCVPEADSESIRTSKEQYRNYGKQLLKYFEEKVPTF